MATTAARLLVVLGALASCTMAEPHAAVAPVHVPTITAIPEPRLPDPPVAAAEPRAPAEPPSPAPLPRGTTVLHIGDSMADALATPLREELARSGVRVINRVKTGSHIPVWGGRFSNVPALVRAFRPDLVLISLGGNEVFLRDPSERAGVIEQLLEYIGDRPCAWIAPSLWKGETGILAVIREHARRCRYYDTNSLLAPLERTRGDPIHPAVPARWRWARAVIGWLAEERDPRGSRPWELRPPPTAESVDDDPYDDP